MSAQTAVESVVAKVALGLPMPVLRRLGGEPLVLDGQTLAADLQFLLRVQRLAGKDRLGNPSVADGRAAMTANAAIAGGNQRIGSARDLEVAGLRARHYLPTGPRPTAPGPLLVFFHGGGFLYGDLDSHDAPCRFLAEQSGVPVLAIDYRLGPEGPFPSAFDDAEAALSWVHDNAERLGVDPQRVGVAGDSAGGNIAAWTAIAAARAGLPLAFQLLVYPCVDADRATESLRLFGDGLYLTAEAITNFNDIYLPTAEARADERVNLLDIDLPEGLAPAVVVTAGFDPLRDEGEAYAARVAAAGVEVDLRRFDDQIHGFLNIVGIGHSSRAAVAEIAAKVRVGLG